MSRLDLAAETTKLARLLDQPEAQLDYLQCLGPVRLRELRERIEVAIFDDAKPMLLRVAAAGKLLPAAALALIGEKVFGPLLCARVAGLMPVERALEVALRLPDLFLADVAVQLEPRSARQVIGRMPATRVVAVAAVLVQRRDYVTMGRFVDYLLTETIRSVLASIHDDAALLHVAFYVESKARLNDIVSLVPESRLNDIVRLAAAPEGNLWPEALALMNHIEPQWRQRIGDMAAAQDEAALTAMLRTAQQQNLWDALMPVVGRMSLHSRQKLARLPALADAQVLASVIAAAGQGDLWDPLLPLVSEMAEPARAAVAQVVERLPVVALQQLFEAVERGALWGVLADLLAPMGAQERRNIARLLAQQPESMLEQLLRSTHQQQLWPRLLPLLEQVPQEQLSQLQKLAARLGLEWRNQ